MWWHLVFTWWQSSIGGKRGNRQSAPCLNPGRGPRRGARRLLQGRLYNTRTRSQGVFVEQAQQRGLDVQTDRNGIIWAWWGGKPHDGASSPGATSIRCPAGVPSTVRSASLPRWPPSTSSKTVESSRHDRWQSPFFRRRKGRALAWRAWVRGSSPARSTSGRP